MAGLTTSARVAKKNSEYAGMINAALMEVHREVSRQAIKQTFFAVVKDSWHDSSNAAFNWQVLTANGSKKKYHSYFGIDPVGSKGDKRSEKGKMADIEIVAAEKLMQYKDVIDKLLNGNKNVGYIKFYNAVDAYRDNNNEKDVFFPFADKTNKMYFRNAGIAETEYSEAVLTTYRRASAVAFEKWKAKYKF